MHSPELIPVPGTDDSISDGTQCLLPNKSMSHTNTGGYSMDDTSLHIHVADDEDTPTHRANCDDIIDWQKTLGDLTDVVAA
eukprot:CAMPEP_0176484978 /NCGR_PEP_ID=MMETSP0200_2-20121128/4797_1 /TAXON_ID=947934 /ORGANISM="Chaetoceros sp., Strain GSL56" /LENGTH=80 /DNA_ID=CAMNT_0017881597 /DNA_START=174 /DNA_END=412 /DNA_ORIENTATION=+